MNEVQQDFKLSMKFAILRANILDVVMVSHRSERFHKRQYKGEKGIYIFMLESQKNLNISKNKNDGEKEKTGNCMLKALNIVMVVECP